MHPKVPSSNLKYPEQKQVFEKLIRIEVTGIKGPQGEFFVSLVRLVFGPLIT